MSLPAKMAAFDHVVYHLTNWYLEKHGQWQVNDLSKLKITKLLFFVTAVTTNPEEMGLLSVFDSFAALPYGHVESEIQNNMQESENYYITKDILNFKVGNHEYTQSNSLSESVIQQINGAIIALKTKNSDLITYSAFDLVDLSHRWQSWKTIFSLAKRNGKLSMQIPNAMIMSEPKIFI